MLCPLFRDGQTDYDKNIGRLLQRPASYEDIRKSIARVLRLQACFQTSHEKLELGVVAG